MAKNTSKDKPFDGTVCVNRRASHEYSIEETYECGMVLTGDEVKSLRTKSVSIQESYGMIRDQELWLIDLRIEPYKMASHNVPQPMRPKKVLLHRREIEKIRSKVVIKGKTIVPLKIYFNERGLAKVLIGIGTGKKQHDRRQDISEREGKREASRAMKQFNQNRSDD